MKSYLAGNPELRLALNEDLVIGKQADGGYGAVVLDDWYVSAALATPFARAELAVNAATFMIV